MIHVIMKGTGDPTTIQAVAESDIMEMRERGWVYLGAFADWAEFDKKVGNKLYEN